MCENAWKCNIIITDVEGNPIDPLTIRNGSSVVFVLGEKVGYTFYGFRDEDGNGVYAVNLGDNRYRIDLIDCSKKYCDFSQFFVTSSPI